MNNADAVYLVGSRKGAGESSDLGKCEVKIISRNNPENAKRFQTIRRLIIPVLA